MSNVAAVRSPAPALRALRRAAVVLAALGAAWLVARVATGPLLAVRHVLVAGESPLPEAEVLAAAGIRTGEPLVGLDPEGVRARLEALPLVRRAEVRVLFPGTVRLTLVRREAVALVVAESGGRSLPALVDADGTIFAMARRPEEADLPVLSGIRLGEAGIGSSLGAGSASLLADLALLRERSPALFRAVSEVRLESTVPVGSAEGTAAGTAEGTAAGTAEGAAGAAARATEGFAGPEFLLYLVSSPVPVRARGSLDERLLQYSLMAQDLLSNQGILDDIQELDFRGGEVVYRMKED
ncbi:MAG: FtsQ-type POTRA domain-containing protein [Spirochaetes bacterium]|nr:FtsQ-type POTRA domain-containing protein [Spirochaetota bacterium]